VARISDAVTMTDDSISIKYLTKSEMRDLFHESNLLVTIENKEITAVLLWERHADPKKSGQVFCTYSQIVSFQDRNGDERVRAHQYLKPDRTIGASHMPDPCRMFLNGVIYKLTKKEKPR
jgi:hypothetical protein